MKWNEHIEWMNETKLHGRFANPFKPTGMSELY
jgi:hypothetical protein